MNPYIDQAISLMDKVRISRFEYPSGDQGAMDQAGCCFIAALIRISDAKKVLEFGSGFSTLTIARELENKKGSLLCSVDSWKNRTDSAKDFLSASSGKLNYRIMNTEMTISLLNGRLLPDYNLKGLKLENQAPFDIVSIDVPPLNRLICEGAVYKAMELLKKGGMIVISDAYKIEPENPKWKKMFKDSAKFHWLGGLGAGIAVIEKIKDGKPEWLGLSENIRESWLTIRQIRQIRKNKVYK